MSIVPGSGTPESLWERWPVLDALPLLDAAPCRRAVVLAPHPDDESLAVGGLIALLLASGAEVVIVAATDGEASHPASTRATPDQLRCLRAAETDAALVALGAGLPGELRLQRLHLPDGALDRHGAELTAALVPLLAPGDWCVAPLDTDGHPDHDAGGRAARAACASTGAHLLSYPLWAWHWAQPQDPRVPWARALRLPLDPDAQRRKRAALACYPSQTEPLGPGPEDAAVVPPAVLAHFLRPSEVLFT